MNMKLLVVLVAFLGLQECIAQYYRAGQCFDKINKQYYHFGAKYKRSKLMGDTTLRGTYSCDCQPGGRMVCTAFDIPCWSARKNTYIPKYEKFEMIRASTRYTCTCLGGFGRYGNCIRSKGCEDIKTKQIVKDGEYYATKRFSATVECLCLQGEPARGSCRPVEDLECNDTETNRTVPAGQSFVTLVRDVKLRCTCGTDGNPIDSSCQMVDVRDLECSDTETNRMVPAGHSFVTLVRGVKLRCTCGTDGNPIDSSCQRVGARAGQCFDRINKQYYHFGAKYKRSKLMGDTTLRGTYSCECQPGSRVVCTAFDIPCWSARKSTYIPKYEKFEMIHDNIRHTCTCLGGFGRYGNCIRSKGCEDIKTKQIVKDGEYYATKRFSATVECLCLQGEPARGSCRPVEDLECNDIETNRMVPAGQSFVTLVRDVKLRCTCGTDGNPIDSSCRRAIVRGCENDLTGQRVSVGESYTVRFLHKNYLCLCGADGRPTRGSCHRSRPQFSRDPCRTADCDNLATCTPHGASYTCRCRTGYTGTDGRNQCRDVNECSRINRCDENASCENTVGSYKCTCNDGFTGDGFNCTESLDHCIEGIFFCDVNAECIPNDESFSCVCINGFTGSGESCQDDDECSKETTKCDQNAHCNNTVGSYSCTCNTGYQGDGYSCSKMCQDEVTKNYVASGDVFIKVKNGKEMACSCRGGEEVEGSCVGEEEEEPLSTTPASESRCHDEYTGNYAVSGEYFSKRIGFVFTRCLCKNGEAVPETCRGSTKLIGTSTTSETFGTRPTSSSSTVEVTPGKRKVRCYDASARKYHEENETYFWNRRTSQYTCRCIRQNNAAVSKCRPVRRRN